MQVSIPVTLKMDGPYQCFCFDLAHLLKIMYSILNLAVMF